MFETTAVPSDVFRRIYVHDLFWGCSCEGLHRIYNFFIPGGPPGWGMATIPHINVTASDFVWLPMMRYIVCLNGELQMAKLIHIIFHIIFVFSYFV